MGKQDVTATAIYKYELTVNGVGMGWKEKDAKVTITAGTAPVGKQFKDWTFTNLTGNAGVENPEVTITGTGDATAVANFEDINP